MKAILPAKQLLPKRTEIKTEKCPLSVAHIPNAQTAKAIQSAEVGTPTPYASVNDLLADLLNEGSCSV